MPNHCSRRFYKTGIKKGGAASGKLDRGQRKTSFPASRMNSAPYSENHPLDSRVARVHALANERGETGPKADTIHTATTDGSPIVAGC